MKIKSLSSISKGNQDQKIWPIEKSYLFSGRIVPSKNCKIIGNQNGLAESKCVVKKSTLDILYSETLETLTHITINVSQKLVKNPMFCVFLQKIVWTGVNILVKRMYMTEFFEKLLVSRVNLSCFFGEVDHTCSIFFESLLVIDTFNNLPLHMFTLKRLCIALTKGNVM